MTCEEVMDLMQRHLDGDLNNEEQRRLSEHLDACPDCAEMMERLERIDRDLASLPKVTPAYSLVDAILPRLVQIDAASESTSAREAAPRVAAERPRRPWYARGAFARYGGMAAAAAVLGVLVVNGLTDSFRDSATRSQESAASGGASADMMMTMEAAMESSSAAQDSAAKRSDAPGSAAAEESPAAEAPAADAPDTSVSSPSAPTPAPKEEAAGGYGGETENRAQNGDVGIMESPSETPGETQPSEGAGSSGFEGQAVGEGEEAPKDAADMPPLDEDGPRYGITGDPGLQDDVKARDRMGSPALMSDDGAYAASVELMPDGMLVVVVNELEGEADYASVHRWPADATNVELLGWEGMTLKYAATGQDGTRTFTIDAASVTETETTAEIE